MSYDNVLRIQGTSDLALKILSARKFKFTLIDQTEGKFYAKMKALLFEGFAYYRCLEDNNETISNNHNKK
jgi:hypothetical protein